MRHRDARRWPVSRRRKPPPRGSARTRRPRRTTPGHTWRDYPIFHMRPPFDGYRQWVQVPRSAWDQIGHPPDDPRWIGLDDEAKDLHNTVVKLAARYHGHVPMAAVYLDRQLRAGYINLAVTGEPGKSDPMPLAWTAEGFTDQARLDGLREAYPWARDALPDSAAARLDVDVLVFQAHELHAMGRYVVDDDCIVHLAIPPDTEGGNDWVLNGLGHWVDE